MSKAIVYAITKVKTSYNERLELIKSLDMDEQELIDKGILDSNLMPTSIGLELIK